MNIVKWLRIEIPFFVLLVFLLMAISVEVMANRINLLSANLPLIVLMIIYLLYKR
jgi:hypothetical protein